MSIVEYLRLTKSVRRLIKGKYDTRYQGRGRTYTPFKIELRRCLKCQEFFESDTVGHRICGRCQAKNEQYRTLAERIALITISILFSVLPLAWSGPSESASKAYLIKAKVSHYCSCVKCCGDYPGKIRGKTASGKMAKANHTLAMPKFFPFGAEVWDDEHMLGVCEDRGSAIKMDEDSIRVDVYCETHEEALRKGVYDAVLLVLVP